MMTYQQVLVISLHKEKTRFKKKLRLSSTRDQVYSQRITTCGLLVTPLRSSLQSFESLKISDFIPPWQQKQSKAQRYHQPPYCVQHEIHRKAGMFQIASNGSILSFLRL
mmetsp:Transcript_4563/g.9384  ORF Transcript_4563/g.9384 Transcript_4563/m.9384 type:complete len:109 (-) Transcript_4563:184-510(-)